MWSWIKSRIQLILTGLGILLAGTGMYSLALNSEYLWTMIYFGLIFTGGMLMLTGLQEYAKKNLEKLKDKEDELSRLKKKAITSFYRDTLTLALGIIYLLTILGLVGWLIPLLKNIPIDDEKTKTILSLATAILSIIPGIKTLVKKE